ncbi:hypothetical protein M422DRAFT_264833 [Sphaerobolus stellatus SS14]|uniref:Uncharacterized protein n=1 Tax=Sphaerobolus stellatus (strain SS14) TaxID=990650 RepID=A0A0C9TSL5_SPHS4|nr:hypothetical protein M422DRAFT_264833 [Sphaerobolus stellatus SS14]
MAPKRRTIDKVPAGTGDAADSGSTPNVIGGNDPTMDPGKDPSQTASTVSEANTICPMTWNTRATDELAHPASERGISEDPTQTPNPHYGSRDPLLPKTYSDYAEPSERSALADPDPEELALGDQIQEMLDTINEHMDEVTSIHNMSHQAVQLLAKTNESNSALEARTRTFDQHNVDTELIQSTGGPNNRSNPKQVLGRARTELLAKTAVLEWLYADQAPADHLNQAATAARSTHMDDNTRGTAIRDNACKSVQYAPFNGIEDNDTDSKTTVRNHREGSVPFQQPDDRDILDMSNNKSDNALI